MNISDLIVIVPNGVTSILYLLKRQLEFVSDCLFSLKKKVSVNAVN